MCCLLGGGLACTPKNLTEAQLQKDIEAQSYVKNCLRQGLVLQETQVLSQTVTDAGLDVLVSLVFQGEQTAQTRTLLCLPVNTLKLKYTAKDRQWQFQRLGLELSRTQLNDNVRAPGGF